MPELQYWAACSWEASCWEGRPIVVLRNITLNSPSENAPCLSQLDGRWRRCRTEY
jgi:hypothetical protein